MSNFRMPTSAELIALSDESLGSWRAHRDVETLTGSGLLPLVVELHRINTNLWDLEDEVRDPESTDVGVARLKRSIDASNLERHRVVELIDELVLNNFAHVDFSNAELHSETAGMMTDRLSILGLKLWHAAARAHDVMLPFSVADSGRVSALQRQRADLGHCIDRLFAELATGRRFYRMYRQFKMYGRRHPV